MKQPIQNISLGAVLRLSFALTLLAAAYPLSAKNQIAPEHAGSSRNPPASLSAHTLPSPDRLRDAGDYYYVQNRRKIPLRRVKGEIGVSQSGTMNSEQFLEKLQSLGDSSLKLVAACDRGRGGGRFFVVGSANDDQPAPRRYSAVATAEVAYAYPVFADPVSRLRLIPTDEALVRLRAGVALMQVEPEIRSLGYRVVTFLGPGECNTFLLQLAEPRNAEPVRSARELALQSWVEWATPNFVREIQFCHIPNDPLFSKQQYLRNTGQNGAKSGADIGAIGAWDITRGTDKVVIAILDTGVDTTHPDLRNWNNTAETGGGKESNGLDDDGNGYIDDYRGWDFSTASLLSKGDNNPNPSVLGNGKANNHGTACAGIAAAIGDNNYDLCGVAPNCAILPVKIAADDGTFADSTHLLDDVRLGSAIYYAASNAAVINCSFKVLYSAYASDAIAYAAESGRNGKGALVFCAAGNDASGWKFHERYPIGALPPGPGGLPDTYRIHFVYQRDTADGVVQLDNVYLLDSDEYTHLDDVLTSDDFESGFLLNAWVRNNTLLLPNWNWFLSSAAPFKGTGGSSSAYGGTLNNPSGFKFLSRLITPPLTLSGDEVLAFHSYYALPQGAYFGIEVWSVLWDAKVKDVLPPSTGNVPSVETPIGWPAGHPDTIAVGASTDCDYRADYSQYQNSQYGGSLDFLAPAGRGWNQVVTLDPTGVVGDTAGDVYRDFDGTSAACPVAAGIGALVLTVNPELTATEVRALMQQTCDRIGGVTYTNGRNLEYGYGRVNASNAVRRAMVNLAVTQTIQGAISLGSPYSYSITVTNRGPSREGAVVLSNQLPASVTFNSASLSQGSYSQYPNNLLVLNLGSLSPGTNATAQLSVTPIVAGTLINRVSASGKAMDQDLADNANSITNTLAAFTNSVVVYDNTQNYLNFYSPTTNELGDEIVLAPGLERSVVGFNFRYYSGNFTPAPEKTAVARFYLKDGPPSFGWPGPGTLLFESPPIPIAANSNEVALVLTNPVAVPSRFIWTVQFSGLATNETAGLLIYDPPTVGSGFTSFWEKTNGVWWRPSYGTGDPDDHGATIRAIPTTPPTLSLLPLSNQTLQIRLAGDPGLRTTLLTSTNLSNWIVWTVVTNRPDGTSLIALPVGNDRSRFFRGLTP